MPQQPKDNQPHSPSPLNNSTPDHQPPDLANAHQLFLEAGRTGLLKGQFLLGPLLFTIPGQSGEPLDQWVFRSVASTEHGIGAVGYFKPLDPIHDSDGWMIAPASDHALFVPYLELPQEVQDIIQHRMHRHMSQLIEAVQQSEQHHS